MFKKIWNDAVWSKVISGLLIIGLPVIGVKLLAYYESITFKTAFNNVVAIVTNVEVKLIYILAALIVLGAFYIIYRKSNKDSIYTRKQEKLRKYNTWEEPGYGIVFRWEVHFDFDKPYIYDLTPFCKLHKSAPLKYIDNRCPNPSCINSINGLDLSIIKNRVESEMLEKWYNINR